MSQRIATPLTGLALVRSVRGLRRCYVKEQTRLMNDVGDIVPFGWPLGFVVAFHPRALEQVLVNNGANYVKSKNYVELAPVLGNGLVTSSGAVWQRSRRIIGQELGHQAARRDGAGFADSVRDAAARWGDVVDVAAAFTDLAFRFTATMLLGPAAAQQATFVHQRLGVWEQRFVRRVYSVVKLPDHWPTPDARRSRQGIADVDAWLAGIIDRFLDEGSAGESWGILGKLVEACRTGGSSDNSSSAVDRRQVRDEIMTLLLAGHDTTAAALTWTSYLLARHPEVQEALADESRAASAGGDLVERLPLHARVVQESLRLFPPVPGFSRDAIADDDLDGFAVKAGSKIELSAYATHRHRDFWSEPERFDPERFSTTRAPLIDPFAYVPFGKGTRICAGKELALQQLVAGLAAVTRTVRLSRRPEDVDVDVDAEPFAAITLRPRGGLPLRVQQR